MMEADRFNRYEENFLNCSRIISRAMIELEKSHGNVDNFISTSVDIEGELSEAEGYLRAMDVEFRTMSSVEKRSTQQKVSDYKEELKSLQGQYQSLRTQIEAGLLKGNVDDATRNKLLSTNEKLDQSTATLELTRMILAETDQMGGQILVDMDNQKKLLIESNQKVKDTKGFTVEARRVLKIMGNRAIMHKIGVGMCMLGLLAAIIGVGYVGFVKKK